MATPMELDGAASTLVPVDRQRDEVRRAVNFQEVAAKMLDLRGLARPPTFTGLDPEWPEFRYRLESLATMLGIDELMAAAAGGLDPLDFDLLTPDERSRSKFLHALLVQLCSGKALAIIKLHEKS
ncbi:unnamed protein product, partial [Polarella glacialis]